MHRHLALILLLVWSVRAASALTDTWAVDVRQHGAVQRTYKQGETWDMHITLRDGLKPLDLTGATAVFYWYTNATQNVWWTNSTAVAGSALHATWTPSMDTGAPLYPYWIGVWPAGATSPLWRVTGTIRLLPSPGFTPNSLPLPQPYIDFATILVTNAPWATSADLDAIPKVESDTLWSVTGRGSYTPHAVTLSKVTAASLRIIEDSDDETGLYSALIGSGNVSGEYSLAAGDANQVTGNFSTAFGRGVHVVDSGAFVYSGDTNTVTVPYTSHGPGTFSIAPVGGLHGFWVGEQSLAATLGALSNAVAIAAAADLRQSIAAIPRVPTNAVQGWMLFDAGSNMWLRVTVSNLSFTVWEVEL